MALVVSLCFAKREGDCTNEDPLILVLFWCCLSMHGCQLLVKVAATINWTKQSVEAHQDKLDVGMKRFGWQIQPERSLCIHQRSELDSKQPY